MKLSSSWDNEYSLDDSLSIIGKLASAHLRPENFLCPRAKAYASSIHSWIKSGDLRSLALEDIENSGSWVPSDLIHLRQALAFYSKNPSFDVGIDRDQVAFDKFMDSERLCHETNSIFRAWAGGDFSFHPRVESQFFLAQRKIARVLGRVPKISDLGLRFGPGSTTSTKKRMASVREKIHARLACSEDLIPVVTELCDEFPVWANFLLEVNSAESLQVAVDPGKVTFVPKSAKTNRAVATEPVLNGMLQLGYGDFISKRLRAVGIDIRDQTLNQRLAREGSLTGALATLDLSSASDTISNEVVHHLLPQEWAFALSYARTRTVSVRGELLRQEKFSSMGNGFTFPLETLIFWGLARACCDDSEIVSVYGDDIIVPSWRAEEVSNLLRCAGFVVNTTKSYSSGPFRESCGKDYYMGIDIRPFYQKSLVSPATLFVLHNFYVRSNREDFARGVLEFIHPSLRIFGPDGYGDGHLLGDWVPRPYKRNIGFGGYLFNTYTFKARRDVRPALPGDFIVPLYSVYIREPTADNDRRALPRERYHGGYLLPEPFGNGWGVPGSSTDGFALPGKKGYKMISIYTLNKG